MTDRTPSDYTQASLRILIRFFGIPEIPDWMKEEVGL